MLPPLSNSEQRVLQLMAQGHSDDAIARQLGVSTATVKSHLTRIYRKWRVEGRVQALLLLWEPHPEVVPGRVTPEEALRLIDALAAALAQDAFTREVRRAVATDARGWKACRMLARQLARLGGR